MNRNKELPEIEYARGATPLTPEEREGLKLRYISARGELDQAEQANITKAQIKLSGRRKLDYFSETFLRSLHKNMYSDVWKWAGSYRKSDKNIGVAWQKVPEEVMKLLKDGSHWVKEEVFPWDELAVRFHHRLVSIHPFPNGNGRFSRFHADLLLKMNAQKPLTWGGGIGADGNVRDLYLAALKEADERRYGDLLKLCRM